MRSLHNLFAGVVLIAAFGACDSSVGLDPNKTSLINVIVAGSCPVQQTEEFGSDGTVVGQSFSYSTSELSTVDVSVLLLGPASEGNSNKSITPKTRVQGGSGDEILRGKAEDFINQDDFVFERSAAESNASILENAIGYLDEQSRNACVDEFGPCGTADTRCGESIVELMSCPDGAVPCSSADDLGNRGWLCTSRPDQVPPASLDEIQAHRCSVDSDCGAFGNCPARSSGNDRVETCRCCVLNGDGSEDCTSDPMAGEGVCVPLPGRGSYEAFSTLRTNTYMPNLRDGDAVEVFDVDGSLDGEIAGVHLARHVSQRSDDGACNNATGEGCWTEFDLKLDVEANLAGGNLAEVREIRESIVRGVNLVPNNIRYSYTGGNLRKDQKRLVVFVVDHSGSLVGQQPGGGGVDFDRANDRDDQRISFLRALVNSFPGGDPDSCSSSADGGDCPYLVSVVRMNTQDAAIVSCRDATPCGAMNEFCSEPTFDKNTATCILDSLQYGEKGGTNMNDTLKTAFDRIITPLAQQQYNPVVVMVTDGVEGGDPTGDVLAPGEALEQYRTGINGEPVPIIVMDLQPRSFDERGRDHGLKRLACETEGEYIFLGTPIEFTGNPDLQSLVRNRILGTWRLTTETNLDNDLAAAQSTGFRNGDYLVSGNIQVTLGKQVTGRMTTDSPETGVGQNFLIDRRLWLPKVD